MANRPHHTTSILLLAACAACLLVLPGFIPRGNTPGNSSGNAAGGEARRIAIYVADNGVHTDIIMPASSCGTDWPELLDFGQGQPPYPRETYMAFGWGARDFYLATPRWQDIRPDKALGALLLAPAALHVELVQGTPIPESDVRRVTIDAEGCRALTAFIRATLAPDAAGRPQRIAHPGYGSRDAFYEATGRFSPVRTCNTWTSEALAAAGVRTALWTPFAWGVMRHLP